MTYMYVRMHVHVLSAAGRVIISEAAMPHPKNHFGFDNKLELGSDLSRLFHHFSNPTERRRHLVRFGGSREQGYI